MKVNNLTNRNNFSHPDENQQDIDMSKNRHCSHKRRSMDNRWRNRYIHYSLLTKR